MKDYHDLLLILREPGLLEPTSLNPAISATFSNRGTPLTLPIEFDESGIDALERRWATHLASLGVFRQKLNLPETIEEVIAEINAWMSKNGFIREVGHE